MFHHVKQVGDVVNERKVARGRRREAVNLFNDTSGAGRGDGVLIKVRQFAELIEQSLVVCGSFTSYIERKICL